jgi:hypothetical protein
VIWIAFIAFIGVLGGALAVQVVVYIATTWPPSVADLLGAMLGLLMAFWLVGGAVRRISPRVTQRKSARKGESSE